MTSEDDPLLSKTDNNEHVIGNDKLAAVWDYDEALDKVGTGWYQYLQWGLILMIALSCGLNNTAMVFEGGTSGYRCETPPNITNNSSSPFSAVLYYPDKCSYKKEILYRNGTVFTESDLKCSSYVYNTSVFASSVISEWDLTCDKEFLSALGATLYMLGFFTGCLCLGYLSDRFGRKKLLIVSLLLSLAAGVGASFSINIYMFLVLKFFIGVGVAGTRNSAYVLGTEVAPKAHRGTIGLLSDMVVSIGVPLAGLIYYLDPNWRRFQLYIGGYHIIYLMYIYFVPKSPRWLISRQRQDEALKYLKTAARFNKKSLPPNLSIKLPDLRGNEKNGISDLLRKSNMRILSLVVCSLWFIVSLNYFGMNWNVSNMKGSIYVNNAILGLVEILANFAGVWIIRIGRRLSIFLSFLGSGLTMGIIIFIHENYWGIIILATLGKFAIAPCFSYIYVSTAELYPVQVRNLVMGIGSAMARLAGALAPFVTQSFNTWHELPYIVFTATSLLGAVITLLLPETKDRPLPDSIGEAAEMNKLNGCTTCRPQITLLVPYIDDEPGASQCVNSINPETEQT